MQTNLPETEHFRVHYSQFTRDYAVIHKPETTTMVSRAMTPMPVYSGTVEGIIPELLRTEREYMENRSMVEKYARTA